MQSFGVGLSAVLGAVGGSVAGYLIGERVAPTFSSSHKKERYAVAGSGIGLLAGAFTAAALATPSPCPTAGTGTGAARIGAGSPCCASCAEGKPCEGKTGQTGAGSPCCAECAQGLPCAGNNDDGQKPSVENLWPYSDSLLHALSASRA